MKEDGLKEKIKKTKAFEWHYDYLTTKNDSKAVMYGNIAVAMFFGNIMSPGMLALLFFLTYAVSFVVWASKNKKEDLEKPPWLQEKNDNQVTLTSEELDIATQCPVKGCNKAANFKIAYEKPYQPVQETEVCRHHQQLHFDIRQKLGRFHSVLRPKSRKKYAEEIQDGKDN